MIWHHTGSLTEIAAALPPEAFITAVKPAGPVEHVVRIAYAYNGLMQDDLADPSWDWVSFSRASPTRRSHSSTRPVTSQA